MEKIWLLWGGGYASIVTSGRQNARRKIITGIKDFSTPRSTTLVLSIELGFINGIVLYMRYVRIHSSISV